MSARGSQITCRRCDETFPIEDGGCPHCGQSVRNTTSLLAGGVLGLLIVVASLFDPGQLAFFGAVGALIAISCGYLVYDKRQRIGTGSEVGADTGQLSVEDG